MKYKDQVVGHMHKLVDGELKVVPVTYKEMYKIPTRWQLFKDWLRRIKFRLQTTTSPKVNEEGD